MSTLKPTLPAIILARLVLGMSLAAFAAPSSAQEDTNDGTELATESAVADAAATDDSSPQRPEPRVMDQIELDTAEITGNQELPKVLYIVPWKDSDPDALPGPPAGTLLNEAPAPLDRDELVRQVEYFDALNGKSE